MSRIPSSLQQSQYTPIRNCTTKKLSTKKSPPRMILTIPFKATIVRTNANDSSGTKVPPSPTITMCSPPPKTLQMSSAKHSLAQSLQTKSNSHAPYPPLGHHPLDATTLLFCKGKKRAAQSTSCPDWKSPKNSRSCSMSVGRVVDKNTPTQGPSPTPSKPDFAIFSTDPSTASTSSLTQGSSMAESSKQLSLPHLRTISQLNVCCSASPQHLCNEPIYPSDPLPLDVYPPLAGFVIPKPATTIIAGNGCSPYVTASDAC
jgi:hypothetical protein